MKKVRDDSLKMPLNSLPDADLNLPEMKTKSSSCPAGGVHMYAGPDPGFLDREFKLAEGGSICAV